MPSSSLKMLKQTFKCHKSVLITYLHAFLVTKITFISFPSAKVQKVGGGLDGPSKAKVDPSKAKMGLYRAWVTLYKGLQGVDYTTSI